MDKFLLERVLAIRLGSQWFTIHYNQPGALELLSHPTGSHPFTLPAYRVDELFLARGQRSCRQSFNSLQKPLTEAFLHFFMSFWKRASARPFVVLLLLLLFQSQRFVQKMSWWYLVRFRQISRREMCGYARPAICTILICITKKSCSSY